MVTIIVSAWLGMAILSLAIVTRSALRQSSRRSFKGGGHYRKFWHD